MLPAPTFGFECVECGEETVLTCLTYAIGGKPDECKYCGAGEFKEPVYL